MTRFKLSPPDTRSFGSERDEHWVELDPGFLKDRGNADLPAFPLDVLVEPWRDWVASTARGAGAPVDYVAHGLLGAVAGLCGAGAVVEVTPAWREPLVLWQALVGGPSSGRSPALAPLAGLLGTLQEEQRASDPEAPRLVVEETGLAALTAAVAALPRGVLLWCDGYSWHDGLVGEPALLKAWSAEVVAPVGPGKKGSALTPVRLAVNAVGCLEAETIGESLEEAGMRFASRLLYAWPQPTPPGLLGDIGSPSHEQALGFLRRIFRKARSPEDPLVLVVDQHGRAALDGFLPKLHAETMAGEGFEAAWLGKGRGSIVRLAGLLEMLVWSTSGSPGLPGHIGRDQVATAVRLWAEYYKPHARAVFGRAAPSDIERRTRRVARWLKLTGVDQVTREEVRCQALRWTVDAEAADMVLYRLAAAGILRFRRGDTNPRGGRRAHQWEVNPALGGL